MTLRETKFQLQKFEKSTMYTVTKNVGVRKAHGLLFVLYVKVVCHCLAMLDKSIVFLSRVACTSAVRSLAPRAVDPPIEML